MPLKARASGTCVVNMGRVESRVDLYTTISQGSTISQLDEEQQMALALVLSEVSVGAAIVQRDGWWQVETKAGKEATRRASRARSSPVVYSCTCTLQYI